MAQIEGKTKHVQSRHSFPPEGKSKSRGRGKPYRAAHYTYDEGIDDGWDPSSAVRTDEHDYEEPEVEPAGLESEEAATAPYTYDAEEAEQYENEEAET